MNWLSDEGLLLDIMWLFGFLERILLTRFDSSARVLLAPFFPPESLRKLYKNVEFRSGQCMHGLIELAQTTVCVQFSLVCVCACMCVCTCCPLGSFPGDWSSWL